MSFPSTNLIPVHTSWKDGFSDVGSRIETRRVVCVLPTPTSHPSLTSQEFTACLFSSSRLVRSVLLFNQHEADARQADRDDTSGAYLSVCPAIYTQTWQISPCSSSSSTLWFSRRFRVPLFSRSWQLSAPREDLELVHGRMSLTSHRVSLWATF